MKKRGFLNYFEQQTMTRTKWDGTD